MTARYERDVNSQLNSNKKRQYREAFPDAVENDDRTGGMKFFKGEKIVTKYLKGVDFCKEKVHDYEEVKPVEMLQEHLNSQPESVFMKD